VIALALASLSTLTASAQHSPASVAGAVRDTAGRPLAGAQVVVVGTRVVAKTDSLGRYEFDSLAAGPTRLRALILGYLSKEQSTVLAPGERTKLDFRVVPIPLSDGGNVVRSVPLEQADTE
jgi:hypothetical protein